MTVKSPKTEKTRTQNRAKRTRKRLKKAALNVFSGKSIAAATVEEITEKADVGKGTLYQHFEDKGEIVVTLVDEAIDHLIEKIRSYDEKPEGLEDMLEHLLDAHYEFFLNSTEEFILLFQGKLIAKLQADTADELEEQYLRYLQEIESQVSSYLSPKMGSVRVRRLACAVAGFVFGFFSFAMIGMTPDQVETSVKPLRRVFVGSLCAFVGR
jgi:AcrR family transcriptional regulator